jgi:RimJ/RimL family protein N-acetyltransferase
MAAAPNPTLMSTNRISLRRLFPDDFQLLCILNNDEGVMTYLDHEPPSMEEVNLEVQHIIDYYTRWPTFGRWIAESPSGEFLGWFSLAGSEQEMPATLEVGYRLRRQYWGMGLATEGTRLLLEYAFLHNPMVERVIGNTMFINERSRHVMEKCGMRHTRTFHLSFEDPLPGSEHGEVLYEITKEEWKKQQT